MKTSLRIGFLGSGGIAQSHAYALDALKYYYKDAPHVEKVLVSSPTPAHREAFAQRFFFQEAVEPQAVWARQDIDTLYILGTNETHTPQLLKAAKIPSIQRIYVEKPIGISQQDIDDLQALDNSPHGKFIMVGFQFLQKSPLRKAIAHWHSGAFGAPVHFRAEYLHDSYIDSAYRKKRAGRLLPIPQQGATVDLGSHPLSLLTAFLGNKLVVKTAAISGSFEDVPKYSDLCTTLLLEEPTSGAAGTLVASRISPGTGDLLKIEIWGTHGALLFSTTNPDSYQTYLPDQGWNTVKILSDYSPASTFPAHYTPSGWLRALVHNHYLFLGGEPNISIIPDLAHGIQVQRLLQQTAEHILSA